MGMFDSFPIKLKCPTCKKTELRDVQTKQFAKVLANYEIGDVVYDAPRGEAWFKEEWWCEECHKGNKEPYKHVIYIRLVDGLYIGHYSEKEYTQARKKTFDTYEVMNLYHDAAEKATERRFLINDIYNSIQGDRERWKREGKIKRSKLFPFEPKDENELLDQILEKIKRHKDPTLTDVPPWY